MNKELWQNQWQRLIAIGATILGALFLFLGWWGVSGAELTTEQIPYLASGAVGGLFLFGIAATLWLSADLRDEYLKLDDIHQVVSHLADGSALGSGVEGAPWEPDVTNVPSVDPEFVEVDSAPHSEQSDSAGRRGGRGPLRPQKA